MEITVIDIETKKEYSIEYKKSGENSQVCPVCSDDRKPEHRKLKCFSYNAEKEAGNCNHCGRKFVKKGAAMTKPEKIEYKKPTWKNSTNLSEKAVKWFEDRGIKQEVLTEMKISEGPEWMPQTQKETNTVQFNYFRDGELINIKYRDGAKNFKMVQGAELIFYNLDAIKGQNEIIIVEGEIDCLSFIQAGIKNVISVPNGATLSRQNLSYFENCLDYFPNGIKVYLALDNDAPGIALRDELARRIGTENCLKVNFIDCKDANESLVKHGPQSLIKSLSDAKEYPIEGIFTSADIDSEIMQMYHNGMPKGIGVDIPEFDNLLSFHLGYLTTITGIPSHGKSEILDFLMTKLNLNGGWKFGLYSPENYPLELHFSKYAEKLIGKSFQGKDRINLAELQLAKDHFQRNFFFIKPEKDFSLEHILGLVRQLVKKHGINAFVIDAWNKLDHQYSQNETQYISQSLDKITLFCEANNVHCFLVAHPTKIQKEKATGKFEVPNLYNISGSANFYNKTHNGICVYRDFEENITKVFIQKVKFKHWGTVGEVHWKWNPTNGRYFGSLPDSSNWLLKEHKQERISFQPNYSFSEPISTPSGGLADEYMRGNLID
jgi:twinkle protein